MSARTKYDVMLAVIAGTRNEDDATGRLIQEGYCPIEARRFARHRFGDESTTGFGIAIDIYLWEWRQPA